MICVQCNQPFEPKPKGYNARYCTDRCKRRNQRARLRSTSPERLRTARQRSYERTKSHPDRLAGHRKGSRLYRQHGREWLAAYKLAQGCVDCGYAEHAAALQLDHTGPKAVEIAEARSSVARLKAEIEAGKCVVRCANCHSIKSWERRR